MKKTKSFFSIISAIIFSISIIFTVQILPTTEVSASYNPEFEISSHAVYMVNADTGRVIYEKNADRKIFPASVTKIMTAVLLLENIKDLKNTEITVTREALAPLEALPYSISHAGLIAGEVFTAYDLLNCIMISSASDAANTVAVYLGGSISGFADMMNEKAESLGMEASHFSNPNGLHEDDHFTSAKDLYILTKYATTFEHAEILMDIATTNTYFFVTNLRPNKDTNIITTTNFMQNQGSPVYMSNVSGFKTGTTNEAGGCFVSTAQKGDYNYILVLMGAPLYDENEEFLNPKVSFLESKMLYEWAFENFSIKTLIQKNGLAAEIPLKLSSEKNFLQLRIEEDYKQLIPINYGEDSVLRKYNLPEFVNAPVKEGDFVGTMDIVVSDEVIGSINLYADETIERSTALYYAEMGKESVSNNKFQLSVFLVIVSVLLFILSVFIINKNKKKNINKAKRRNNDFTRHY